MRLSRDRRQTAVGPRRRKISEQRLSAGIECRIAIATCLPVAEPTVRRYVPQRKQELALGERLTDAAALSG